MRAEDVTKARRATECNGLRFWLTPWCYCDLNSLIQIALSPDRTRHTDVPRAVTPMEHEEHRKRTGTSNPWPPASIASWAWLEWERLLPRAVEILASDTLGPAAQSRRALQLHRSYGSSMECSKDDYSFSKKYERMRRADWKDLVLLPDSAWFRALYFSHKGQLQQIHSKFYLAWLFLPFGRTFWPPILNKSCPGNAKDY